MSIMPNSTGKRFKTGQVVLTETAREITVEVPFTPSYAFICKEGTIEEGSYRTVSKCIISLVQNTFFTTGIIHTTYDSNGNGIRYAFTYDGSIPYSNGIITFSPRSASFPWDAGTYTYMLIE